MASASLSLPFYLHVMLEYFIPPSWGIRPYHYYRLRLCYFSETWSAQTNSRIHVLQRMLCCPQYSTNAQINNPSMKKRIQQLVHIWSTATLHASFSTNQCHLLTSGVEYNTTGKQCFRLMAQAYRRGKGIAYPSSLLLYSIVQRIQQATSSRWAPKTIHTRIQTLLLLLVCKAELCI